MTNFLFLKVAHLLRATQVGNSALVSLYSGRYLIDKQYITLLTGLCAHEWTIESIGTALDIWWLLNILLMSSRYQLILICGAFLLFSLKKAFHCFPRTLLQSPLLNSQLSLPLLISSHQVCRGLIPLWRVHHPPPFLVQGPLNKSLIHGNSQSSWVSYFKSHRWSENKSYPYYFKLLFQMLPFLLFSIWLPFIRFPVFIFLFSDVLALLERLRFTILLPICQPSCCKDANCLGQANLSTWNCKLFHVSLFLCGPFIKCSNLKV